MMERSDLQFERDYSSPVISRWWILVLAFVFIYGFSVLITVTVKAYTDKPPVPEVVKDIAGTDMFTGD